MSLCLASIAVLMPEVPAIAATPPPAMTTCPIDIRSLDVTPTMTDSDRGRHQGTEFITFRSTCAVAASHVTSAFCAAKSYVKSVAINGLFSPRVDMQ